MTANDRFIQRLNTLNHITDTLNRTLDVASVLDQTLVRLVDLMGLQAGWIFLRDSSSQNQWSGRGFVLAAHYNLPPAMAPGKPTAWKGGCDCQSLCSKGQMNRAYNTVLCSRLANTRGDKRGLTVHASTPLVSGDEILGILNVAGPNWDTFTEESLSLLTNVGSQMGIAIERARLIQMMQKQRLHEQGALLELSSKLLDRGLDSDDLIAHVTDEVRKLLKADACALLMPDETDACLLSFCATSGWYGDPVVEKRKVPADDRSGPGLAMRIQQPFLIKDLRDQERPSHTPLAKHKTEASEAIIPASWTDQWLQAEQFRGPAVVPLIVEERSIGAMVINMRQPRLVNEEELRFLRLMANQAAIIIEKSRLIRERIKRERLEEELAIGQRIQLSLLPETDPILPGWEFASFYQPARQIGGDFYDFFQLTNNGKRLGLVIGDVSGKGVSAALFMALSRSIIRTKAFTGRRPWDVLRRSNRIIFKDSRSNLFLTAFYGTLDTHTGHLIFTNAGHNRPLWYSVATGVLQELATPGIVLGVFERVRLGEGEIDIAPGDFLICYTDGVTEAMNEQNKMFGEARLETIVRANPRVSAQGMRNAIVQAIEDFTGGQAQSDDITLFVVKREM